MAEQVRAALLQSLDGDLVLMSSMFEGYGDDAVTALPPGTLLPPTVGICYDLIPFLRPNAYLTSARCRSWYYRRLLQMRRMAGLLAISEWSRGEAVGRFGYPPEDVTNILAGVGPQFRPERDSDEAEAALLARYGLQPGFILCIGAVDPRKNLDGLHAPMPCCRPHCGTSIGWLRRAGTTPASYVPCTPWPPLPA